MTIFFPIIGFILLIILVFIVIGLTILSKVIKTILGLGQKMTGKKPSSAYTSSGRNDGQADPSYTSADNILAVIPLKRRKYSIQTKANTSILKK